MSIEQKHSDVALRKWVTGSPSLLKGQIGLITTRSLPRELFLSPNLNSFFTHFSRILGLTKSKNRLLAKYNNKQNKNSFYKVFPKKILNFPKLKSLIKK